LQINTRVQPFSYIILKQTCLSRCSQNSTNEFYSEHVKAVPTSIISLRSIFLFPPPPTPTPELCRPRYPPL